MLLVIRNFHSQILSIRKSHSSQLRGLIVQVNFMKLFYSPQKDNFILIGGFLNSFSDYDVSSEKDEP